MFAFFIYDKRDDSFFVARDHVGIIPLYIGWGDDGSVWISSEMKVRISDICIPDIGYRTWTSYIEQYVLVVMHVSNSEYGYRILDDKQ